MLMDNHGSSKRLSLPNLEGKYFTSIVWILL
jgi:hypothetical protein